MAIPRFVSVAELARGAASAARRFPFVVASASVALAFAWIFVQAGPEAEPERFPYLRHWLVAQAGIPVFLALTLLAEAIRSKASRLLPVLGIGLLGAWALFAREHVVERLVAEGLGVLMAGHLLVAFLPFAPPGRRRLENAFWQYNRVLFLRFVTAGIFSATLFVGCAGAMLAVDRLLGIDVPGVAYARVFATIGIGFNTLVFLAGVPRHPESLESDSTYPAVVRVFAQFILLPLLSLYLVILYAYGARIALVGELPQGVVAPLVFGVGGLGVFTLLLLRPATLRPEGWWIALFTRAFFAAILPALALFFVALGVRVREYGFTEHRLAPIVLGAWLAVLSVYALARRGFAPFVVPASLFVVVSLATFGPWSVFSVSLRDQASRFVQAARAAGAWDERGYLASPAASIPFEPLKALSRTAFYIAEKHGPEAFLAVLSPNVRARVESQGALAPGGSAAYGIAPEAVVVAAWKELGIEYVPLWATPETRIYSVRGHAVGGAPVPVGGFEVYAPLAFRTNGNDREPLEIVLGSEGRATLPRDVSMLRVEFRGDTFEVPLASLVPLLAPEPASQAPFLSLETGGSANGNAVPPRPPPAALDIAGESARWRYVLRVGRLSARKTDGGHEIGSFDAALLLAPK